MNAAEPENVTRKGKIARLPRAVREQLCERLRDGEMAPVILPWVNALPAAKAVLERDFVGAEITPDNLSQWRLGGYKDWLRQQERVEHISKLSDMSLRLAQASGGNLAEGAIAIAAGQILEVFEDVAALPLTPDRENGGAPDFSGLVDSLVALRNTEIGTQKVAIDRVKLEQKGEQLALERARFERQTAELFLKWYANEQAKEIAAGGAGREVKIDELRALMFGRRPAATEKP